jgi:protein-tyrosine phosphatase
MDWITDEVAVGNYLEAQDAGLLRQEGIVSVLGLTRTLHGRNAAELGLKEIEVVPLEDGPGNEVRLFRSAVDALARLVRESAPVLVHCHAGRSRSAVVVAAHLMRSLEIEADEALALVSARRPVAVAPGWNASWTSSIDRLPTPRSRARAAGPAPGAR